MICCFGFVRDLRGSLDKKRWARRHSTFRNIWKHTGAVDQSSGFCYKYVLGVWWVFIVEMDHEKSLLVFGA